MKYLSFTILAFFCSFAPSVYAWSHLSTIAPGSSSPSNSVINGSAITSRLAEESSEISFVNQTVQLKKNQVQVDIQNDSCERHNPASALVCLTTAIENSNNGGSIVYCLESLALVVPNGDPASLTTMKCANPNPPSIP